MENQNATQSPPPSVTPTPQSTTPAATPAKLTYLQKYGKVLWLLVVLVVAGISGNMYIASQNNPAPQVVVQPTQSPSPLPTVSPAETYPTQTVVEGKMCGGIAAIACPSGYMCKLDGDYPDAGGKCTAEAPARPDVTTKPEEEMPMCTMDAKQCSDGSWVGRTGPKCEFKCPGE